MPRTAAPSRSLRSGSRTDSFEIISAPPRHPAVRIAAWLVRMRAELFVLAVCVTVWMLLTPTYVDTVAAPGAEPVAAAVPGTGLGLAARITVCVVIVALLAGLPWTRRYLLRRFTAVVTRHRLRQTLVECRALNYSRAAPLMLWSHPTRVGESVWIFLRAGIAPQDIDGQCAWIAAGCFAREARVIPNVRVTALVRVEVIRRDPLAPESIDSDLGPWAVGWSDPVIPKGADPQPPRRPTSTTRPTAASAAPQDPALAPESFPAPRTPGDDHGANDDRSAGRGGDWSDYV